MFGELGGAFGGLGGDAMGGAFGELGGAQMNQLMQNPMMRQMMVQLMSDPQVLDQLIESNPMHLQMTQQNPWEQ